MHNVLGPNLPLEVVVVVLVGVVVRVVVLLLAAAIVAAVREKGGLPMHTTSSAIHFSRHP